MKKCEQCGAIYNDGNHCPMCGERLVEMQQNGQYAYQQQNPQQNGQYAYQQQNPQQNGQYTYQQQNIRTTTPHTKQEYVKLFGEVSKHGLGICLTIFLVSLLFLLTSPLIYGLIGDIVFPLIGLDMPVGFVVIIFLIVYLVNKSRFIKLCEAGYYDAILNEYTVTVQKYSGCRLSMHFLFGGFGRVEALRNIIWAYGHTQTTRYYGIPVSKQCTMVLVTQNNKKLSIMLKRKKMDEQIQQIVPLIKANNPNALIGYTDANQNIIDNYFKQKRKNK